MLACEQVPPSERDPTARNRRRLVPLSAIGVRGNREGLAEGARRFVSVVSRWNRARVEPSRFFETMQRGKQGARLNVERPMGGLANAPRDAEAVELLECEGLQNE